MIFHHGLVVLFATIFLLHQVAADSSMFKKAGSWFSAPRQGQAGSQINDLPELHVSIQNTLDVVHSLRSMPACNQLASATLLHNCATIEGTSGPALESLKTLYATRLAVCELIDAGIDIPRTCTAFRPSTAYLRKIELRGFIDKEKYTDPTTQYPVFEEQTRQASEACTKDLHATPQFWTSFSNSKQNALAMCHAMRAPNEKDDMLEAYAKMSKVTFRAASALSDHTDTYDSMRLTWSDLISEMQNFSQVFAASLHDIVKEQQEYLVRELSLANEHVYALREQAGSAVADFKIWRFEVFELATEQRQLIRELKNDTTSLVEVVEVGAGFSKIMVQNIRVTDQTVATLNSTLHDMQSVTSAAMSDVHFIYRAIARFTGLFRNPKRVVAFLGFASFSFLTITPIVYVQLTGFEVLTPVPAFFAALAASAGSAFVPLIAVTLGWRPSPMTKWYIAGLAVVGFLIVSLGRKLWGRLTRAQEPPAQLPMPRRDSDYWASRGFVKQRGARQGSERA